MFFINFARGANSICLKIFHCFPLHRSPYFGNSHDVNKTYLLRRQKKGKKQQFEIAKLNYPKHQPVLKKFKSISCCKNILQYVKVSLVQTVSSPYVKSRYLSKHIMVDINVLLLTSVRNKITATRIEYRSSEMVKFG